MFKRLLTTFFIITIFTVIAESKLSIVNGRDAKPGEFPYMVSVQIYAPDVFKHFCGGSILTPSWVLTAARCYYSELFYRVLAGGIKLNEKNPERQARHVKQFILHPDYKDTDIDPITVNDIALAQLTQPLVFNKFIQPIELPKSGSGAIGLATGSGWGFIVGFMPTNILQTTEIPILPDPVCEQNSTVYNKSIHMCVRSDGKGVCYSDSGGPLVQDGKAVGILLCNKECADGIPNIFTKVSSFIDFIEKYIHPSN